MRRPPGPSSSASPRSVLSGLTVDELCDATVENDRLERRAQALGAPCGELDAARQTPMLCTSAAEVADRPDFIYEIRLDGFRIVAEKRGQEVALDDRRRGPATSAFPEVVRALRHPVFRGIRDDVPVSACVMSPGREQGTRPPSERDGMLVPEALVVARAAPPPGAGTGANARRVRVSNPKKNFWPADGLTKGDLCAYHERIAPFLLPYLRSRPVVLVRYPDGSAGKSFYQWNVPAGTPSWIPTLAIARDDDEGQSG